MSRSRNNEWSDGREVYSANQVEAVLRDLGIEVREDTANDFLSFCPYHGNHDSPAFSTSKRYGYSICFNPSCAVGSDEPLTLERLVREQKGLTVFEAKRLVRQKRNSSAESFEERFNAIDEEPEEMKEFPQAAIDKMHERFINTPEALDYMLNRGMSRETLDYFKVGFTLKSTGYGAKVYRPYDMIVVPAYDHTNRPVGLVARSIEGKHFKNYGPEEDGTGFHKSKMIWNLQNARRYDTVIICESTFDAMRIHQAGYPNVVALLGGTLSAAQTFLLKRHFERVVIMTDNETGSHVIFHRHCRACLRAGNDRCTGHKPGRELGVKIAESLPTMITTWATYDDREVYPHGAKDACDMTDQEIVQCLRNNISHFEYLDWVD